MKEYLARIKDKPTNITMFGPLEVGSIFQFEGESSIFMKFLDSDSGGVGYGLIVDYSGNKQNIYHSSNPEYALDDAIVVELAITTEAILERL